MWKSIAFVGIESRTDKVKLPQEYLLSANSVLSLGRSLAIYFIPFSWFEIIIGVSVISHKLSGAFDTFLYTSIPGRLRDYWWIIRYVSVTICLLIPGHWLLTISQSNCIVLYKDYRHKSLNFKSVLPLLKFARQKNEDIVFIVRFTWMTWP